MAALSIKLVRELLYWEVLLVFSTSYLLYTVVDVDAGWVSVDVTKQS